MAGNHRAGGHNRIDIAEHLARGTFRPHRHAVVATPPPPPVPEAARLRVLRGLPPTARRVAGELLDTFDGWDSAKLESLRSYAMSCSRLEAMQSDPEADLRLLHAEARCNLALLKSLDLERTQ